MKEWYLIKHMECGACFTIDAKTFADSFKTERDRDSFVKCPNCDETVLNRTQKDHILSIFENNERLLGEGIEIKRLEEDAVLSIMKALK